MWKNRPLGPSGENTRIHDSGISPLLFAGEKFRHYLPQRLRLPVEVAFDGEAERPADFFQLREPEVTEFRLHAADKTEQKVLAVVLGPVPSPLSVRSEQLEVGYRVSPFIFLPAERRKLFTYFFGDKLHDRLLSLLEYMEKGHLDGGRMRRRLLTCR